MTQTHSVSLGCPGCPKKSQHFFSPPNARADQRTARTRFASGDISRALNNPSVVQTSGAIRPTQMPHALTAPSQLAAVYIRTRSVHVAYTLFLPHFPLQLTPCSRLRPKNMQFQKLASYTLLISCFPSSPPQPIQSTSPVNPIHPALSSRPPRGRTYVQSSTSQNLAGQSICTICIRRK